MKTANSTPPCECGSEEASWHGDRCGIRQYMCEKCWKRGNKADPILKLGIPAHFRPSNAKIICKLETHIEK